MAIERLRLKANGLLFDAAALGPPDGELVLLLHGFPQTGMAWRAVMRRLATAGYRAVAPDQRGYSPGARPAEVEAYAVAHLRADVLAMASALGARGFHVVGHDWGGVVAWSLAAEAPDRVRTVTVLSTPHPRALRDALRSSDQAMRSAYIPVLRLPLLPELALGLGGGQVLRGMLQLTGLPAPLSASYARAMTAGGALTGALNWYRALDFGERAAGPIQVPATYVWGERDPVFSPAASRATEAQLSGDHSMVPLVGAGHWLPETRAAEVAGAVIARAGSAPQRRAPR
ncbi:MAG: alpha/beta fold hydrolase [Candidatus Dormibacteria bacterium]